MLEGLERDKERLEEQLRAALIEIRDHSAKGGSAYIAFQMFGTLFFICGVLLLIVNGLLNVSWEVLVMTGVGALPAWIHINKQIEHRRLVARAAWLQAELNRSIIEIDRFRRR
jgi:hypothetical protein